jgi:acetyl-CoA acetyltransferase family protein
MPALCPSTDIVLAAGLRTPFVRAGGVFKREDAGHLGARVAREVLAQNALEPDTFDELICGCVGQPFDQANVGRVIALRAGLDESTPARTVARNCASGIEMVTEAATAIEAGYGETYLCVGVEVMSSYPLVFGRKMTDMFARLAGARSGMAKLKALSSFRPSFLAPRIALLEGLTDPTCGMIMGSTAELLARDFGISREEADAYALQSHRRAKAAREEGLLSEEILPHLGAEARAGAASVEHDDGIRDDQTLEALAKLRPYFEKPDGVVTVGNACGISDGAVAMIVTTGRRAQELDLEVLAHLRSFAWAGLDPKRMGLGPVFSSAQALEAAECELSDMHCIELNEAFAAQVLACVKAFESDDYASKHLGRKKALGELDPKRLNVHGGAIAQGHPVGATGGRLLLTAARELQRSDGELALATLCIGGGQGGAVVLERGDD